VLTGWSEDLSFGYYRRMLEVLTTRYSPRQLRDAVEAEDTSKPLAFVRHDVDVCPRAALRMARLEIEHGLNSTYLFMVNSPLYRVEDREVAAIMALIADLGHEVGLHFDLDENHRIAGCTLEVVEQEMAQAAARVERASGQIVRSVSFHRPIDTFLRGPLLVGGLVNAYAAELMGWYLSDSNGCWREGEPIPSLMSPRHSILQMLVHPIWWGEAHMSYEDRLCAYHMSQEDASGDLDNRIFTAIGLRRRQVP
jgi:hypothetical protein